MIHTFRYRIDRRTWYWTLLHVVVYLGLGVAFYLLYEGGYFSAWFASSIGALMLLMALSIPRPAPLVLGRLGEFGQGRQPPR